MIPSITRFQGQYGFLSNFWLTPIRMGHMRYPTADLPVETYPSVEHAYQAAKTSSAEKRAWIREAPTPGEAKRRGARLLLHKSWNDVRRTVMLRLVREKFKGPELADALIATGDALLVEGNAWNDTYWGVCDGVGENHLGKILMEVRAECVERLERARRQFERHATRTPRSYR